MPHERVLSERETSQTRVVLEQESNEDDEDSTNQNIALKDDIFEQETLRSIREVGNLTVSQTQTTSSSSLYSPKTCPICLIKYKTGDEIAWSKNEGCYHAYHFECIEVWLMNHDNCPICRRDYLVAE